MHATNKAGRKVLIGLAALASAVTIAQTSAPPADASEPTPAVWIGSPVVSATWPNADGCGVGDATNCSLPSEHHTTYTNTSNGELGDWAADLQSVAAGDPVTLYAAPQGGDFPVTATVQGVGPACASGNLDDGGARVTIELSTGATKIGTVTFAHVNPLVSQGQVIDRWNTTIGTVGAYNDSSCWKGVHIHLEMSSQTKYGCYNSTYAAGQALSGTNFIGFIGGSFATGRGQGCP